MSFKTMRLRAMIAAALAASACAFTASLPAAGDASADDALLARGRYLVRIGGCNDCHTPNYAETGGNVPEALWLTGNAVGWQGPWGTTYPANLRNYMQTLSADAWVQVAHSAKFRPPMPWFSLRDMSETDLRAIHALLRHLGPAGGPAPAFVPPGQPATGPVVRFPAEPQLAGTH